MKLTITLMMMCLSLSSYGRHPAVDPFVGVEPSGYVDRAPSSEKPYNFETATPVIVEVKTTSKAPASVPLLVKEEAAQGGFTISYFFILIGLITLPFAVWHMMMNRLPEQKSTNVVSFPAKKEDNDDDWKKKAS